MNSAYLVLKAAQTLFGKPPLALAEAELTQARTMAEKQSRLESLVLSSPEARHVVVPAATLESACATVRARYDSEERFAEDLQRNQLSPQAFQTALEQELKVEAILETVGMRAADVSDIDVELYYHYHPDQFRRAETRHARHILVTINEDFPDNRRDVALARVQAIAARLRKNPARFEEQAMKHSECPTALQGGDLGEVRPGQLYPELEQALYALEPGHLSDAVESSLGYHLLRCDRITPAAALTLDQARAPIRKLLESRRRRVCQQAWLKTLRQTTPQA